MRTFKLWLINDPDIPGFKKLAWDIVEVEIRDVLKQGIHPWGDRDTCRTLMERFLQVLPDNIRNNDDCSSFPIIGRKSFLFWVYTIYNPKTCFHSFAIRHIRVHIFIQCTSEKSTLLEDPFLSTASFTFQKME